MEDFYDRFAPFYHLIYDDWDAAMAWQGERLHDIIRAEWGETVKSVLDVSCGIGTQSMALAALGYQVTASDLSPGMVAQARVEAEARNLHIPFSVCDMRALGDQHGSGYDLVISGGNSVPHLLSDKEILLALGEMHACLRPGGGCLLVVRDYDQEPRGHGLVTHYTPHDVGDKRYMVFQVRDYEGEQYIISMYVVEDDRQAETVQAQVMRSRYYAISPNRLLELMEQAGFEKVRRLDGVFFMPVLVGTRSA